MTEKDLLRKDQLLARVDAMIAEIDHNGKAEMDHARKHKIPYDVQEAAQARVILKRRLRALRKTILDSQ